MGIEFNKLGKRIAQRRHELGYKQCVLAEKARISNNYLSNIDTTVVESLHPSLILSS